jgi:integrase
LGAGLRWGEVAGLRVRDVLFDQHTIIVRNVIVEYKDEATKKTVVEQREHPKNKLHAGHNARRVEGVDDDTLALIQQIIDRDDLTGKDLIFRGPQGKPLTRSTFYSVWDRAREILGLPEMKAHNLRATYITWLLNGGAPIPIVAEQVGHERWSTTKGYWGSTPGNAEIITAAMAKMRAKTPSDAGEPPANESQSRPETEPPASAQRLAG